MNEKKTKCFFCKNDCTQTIFLTENSKPTKVCDSCKNSFEKNSWVFSEALEMKPKGVNPTHSYLYKKNKK